MGAVELVPRDERPLKPRASPALDPPESTRQVFPMDDFQGRYAFSDMPVLKRTAAEYLAGLGRRGATAVQIARVCLKSRRVPAEVASSLVRALLGSDRRFSETAPGCWTADTAGAGTEGGCLRSAVFTVIDVETTGMGPVHRIIEIGAVRVEGLGIARTFETLVDAGVPVPSEITSLTGITSAMLEGAPGPAEAVGGLLDFMSDSIFAAHNAPFDRSFVFREAREYCGRTPDNPVVCTRLLARRAVPGLSSYSLDSVSNALGHGIERRHRALDDARAAALILVACVERLMEIGARTPAELVAIQRKAEFDRFLKGIRPPRRADPSPP